jgi:hypothetical protein
VFRRKTSNVARRRDGEFVMKRLIIGLMTIGFASPALAVTVGQDGGCEQGAGTTVVCGTKTYTNCHVKQGGGWNCYGAIRPTGTSGNTATPAKTKGGDTLKK